MPTADDYDVWSRSLQQQAEEMTGVVGPLVAATTPDVIVGGRLAVVVDVAVRTSQANVRTIAGMLEQLADECMRRAEICRAYDVAIGQYAAARDRWELVQRTCVGEVPVLVMPPAPPVPPARPASWVEVARG